ncbi:MAG TPA: hypothetical protein VK633_15310 [Verrucomicrobiae bacterium]|nr:hypothetical protein [Verrucomicrobiae bacterium]
MSYYFRPLRDPLFVFCTSSYALNRWILRPRVHSDFLRFWLADLLLIPCAVPILLSLFRLLQLPASEEGISWKELAWILALWSVLFEVVGPLYLPNSTGDWNDVLMYWTGGLVAWIYWNRKRIAVILK